MKNPNNKKIRPNFDSLDNPETYKNHLISLKEITGECHSLLLKKLLEQFKPLDFEKKANPGEEDSFKISNVIASGYEAILKNFNHGSHGVHGIYFQSS